MLRHVYVVENFIILISKIFWILLRKKCICILYCIIQYMNIKKKWYNNIISLIICINKYKENVLVKPR